MKIRSVSVILLVLAIVVITYGQGGLAGSVIQGATGIPGTSDYVLGNKLSSAGNYKGSTRLPGDPLYYGVTGSPFFLDSFLKSDIVLTDGKLYTDIPLMYDVCNDIALIISNHDTLALDKTKIKSFRLKDNNSDSTYLFELFALESSKNNLHEEHFIEVAFTGKIAFLIRHIKELSRANFDPTFHTGSNYDEYTSDNSYIFKNREGKMMKIRLNRKSVLEVLSDKKEEIKRFVTENKLDYNNEKNVIRIFKYYDSLIND
jgi:hypothetical protein